MDDRTPEEIAMGLSKRMRSLLTELPDDGPMVDFRPCVFDFPMPTLMALVKAKMAITPASILRAETGKEGER